MSFYGKSFLYDSTPSELYGLYIANIDANAVNASMGSSSMDIYEKKIFRKATPYFYGSTPSPKLEFEFSAFAEQELDATQFELIQKWLFSSRTYKRFAIDQPDIQNIYFNAILNDPKIQRVGNFIQGFSCTVTCDSPFAYRYPQTTTYTYTSSVVDSTEVYYNMSDDTGDYLYPTQLIITMNNTDGEVSITNLDDNNRIMSFTGVQPNEILTVSPLYQTIESSTGLKRMGNFNKKFLRLVPNKNRLRIQGNVESIVMINQWVAKKISG
jgi:phage-related protein